MFKTFFIEDNTNNSLFFFCDSKRNGNGFYLRHMRCGPNRFFEANLNACVLKGTTRNIRNENEKPEIIIPEESSQFNCTKKKPGKYPDENCHIYHLCLRPDLFSPFDHLVVECPHSTAYDQHTKKCSKAAKKRCNSKESSNIFCPDEVRYRETRSCKRYFLCYQDQVMHFSCPKGFEFDENLQYCEPEKLVNC